MESREVLNRYAVLLVSDTRVLEIIIFGNIKVIAFITPDNFTLFEA